MVTIRFRQIYVLSNLKIEKENKNYTNLSSPIGRKQVIDCSCYFQKKSYFRLHYIAKRRAFLSKKVLSNFENDTGLKNVLKNKRCFLLEKRGNDTCEL